MYAFTDCSFCLVCLVCLVCLRGLVCLVCLVAVRLRRRVRVRGRLARLPVRLRAAMCPCSCMQIFPLEFLWHLDGVVCYVGLHEGVDGSPLLHQPPVDPPYVCPDLIQLECMDPALGDALPHGVSGVLRAHLCTGISPEHLCMPVNIRHTPPHLRSTSAYGRKIGGVDDHEEPESLRAFFTPTSLLAHAGISVVCVHGLLGLGSGLGFIHGHIHGQRMVLYIPPKKNGGPTPPHNPGEFLAHTWDIVDGCVLPWTCVRGVVSSCQVVGPAQCM